MKAKLFSIIASLIAGSTMVTAQTVDTVLATNLSGPYNAIIDGEENVYISDSGQDRILKFRQSSGQITILAGKTGVSGTNTGTGLLNRLNKPQGMVLARGGLVIADSANQLIRFVSFNGVVSNIAGAPLSPGASDGKGDASRFNYPSALAADGAGNIYVADSQNGLIRKIDSNDQVTTIATGLFNPAGIAVGDNGDIWISDTRKQVIQKLGADGVMRIIAGTRGSSGSEDSDHGLLAKFNHPRGLLWVNKTVGLLVADGGGHTIRRIYFSSELEDYVVETFAGTPDNSGFLDGNLTTARFNNPVALTRDPENGGFLVVDRANNALRRIQLTPNQPPLADPQIGIVLFPPPDFTSQLFPLQNGVFNNDVILAVLREEGSEAYFTKGPTPASPLEDFIPIPSNVTGTQTPTYHNGLFRNQVLPTLFPPEPDVMVKVISSQDGRRSSKVVTARYQFRTANPLILGDNAAAFNVTNVTDGSVMFYTIDGTDPSRTSTNDSTVGPIPAGQNFSFLLKDTDLTVKIQAFRDGFAPSDIVKKVFSTTNFVANRLTFGFENGEASSEFIGASGQRFYAPVTLSLVGGRSMYSLQFNMTVTNLSGPPVAGSSLGFISLLMKPITIAERTVFVPIEPSVFGGEKTFMEVIPRFDGTFFTNFYSQTTFSNLIFTNFSANLIGVGWIERRGQTNLYNTVAQNLVSFSQAHNRRYLGANGKVIVGGYSFRIPSSARENDTYKIQIERPSATLDGVDADLYIEAPTNKTVSGGSLNAVKYVKVGSRLYLVGDCLPFRWFNAGDFGDGRILNNDILQVFQTAIYGLNPPLPGSDFMGSLDSSDGEINPFLDSIDGNDLTINDVKYGDGALNIDDLYVTFRRSLDPTLKWYARYWSNGILNAVEVPNRYNTNDLSSQSFSFPQHDERIKSVPSDIKPFVTFSADDIVLTPGQTSVSVPIRANIAGNRKLRALLLSLSVVPLGNTPPITIPVTFAPNPDLNAPFRTDSFNPNHFGAVWLGENVLNKGLAGNAILGNLNVILPTGLPADAAYKIHFEHVSGSPNGLGLFPKAVHPGLITAANVSGSIWKDKIPDSWRLRYFGTLKNILGLQKADADGDGANNEEEFQAGTNPNDPMSAFKLIYGNNRNGTNSIRLRWPSVHGKSYIVEKSPVLIGGEWTVITSNLIGTGLIQEFSETNTDETVQFFRVRTEE